MKKYILLLTVPFLFSCGNGEKNKDDFKPISVNDWSAKSQKEFIESCMYEYSIDEELNTMYDYSAYKDYCYCGLEDMMSKWPSEKEAVAETMDMTLKEMESLWYPCAEEHFGDNTDTYEPIRGDYDYTPRSNNDGGYVPQSFN